MNVKGEGDKHGKVELIIGNQFRKRLIFFSFAHDHTSDEDVYKKQGLFFFLEEFGGENAKWLLAPDCPEWREREKPYYILFGRDEVLPIYNIMKEAK